MNVLIKKAKVICPTSKYHQKTGDILVKKGEIEAIRKNIKAEGRIKTIEGDNLHCSLGWVDIGCYSGEPGKEHRETLDSLARSAAAGGYTHIAPMPNTEPALDHKAGVHFLRSHPANQIVRILPLGAVSKGIKGEEITEMLDLAEAGVYGFSDGLKSIQKSGLLLRALQYLKRIDGVLFHHSEDVHLSTDGQIHEGRVSTQLGMKGIPSMSEEISIQRDLELNKYAEGSLVFHAISTGKACKLIRKAQKNGDQVASTVSFVNLVEQVDKLLDFNSNYKVKPPLREEEDRKALIKGVKNGTIKAIVSNHKALEEEKKKLEFSYASFGMTSLEVVFAVLCDQLLDKELSLEEIIYCLAEGPRHLLKMDLPTIEVGSRADLCIFDPSSEWEYQTSKSLSRNSPYLGRKFKGQVLQTIVPAV